MVDLFLTFEFNPRFFHENIKKWDTNNYYISYNHQSHIATNVAYMGKFRWEYSWKKPQPHEIIPRFAQTIMLKFHLCPTRKGVLYLQQNNAVL
jgi:hypothetical protein